MAFMGANIIMKARGRRLQCFKKQKNFCRMNYINKTIDLVVFVMKHDTEHDHKCLVDRSDKVEEVGDLNISAVAVAAVGVVE